MFRLLFRIAAQEQSLRVVICILRSISRISCLMQAVVCVELRGEEQAFVAAILDPHTAEAVGVQEGVEAIHQEEGIW